MRLTPKQPGQCRKQSCIRLPSGHFPESSEWSDRTCGFSFSFLLKRFDFGATEFLRSYQKAETASETPHRSQEISCASEARTHFVEIESSCEPALKRIATLDHYLAGRCLTIGGPSEYAGLPYSQRVTEVCMPAEQPGQVTELLQQWTLGDE